MSYDTIRSSTIGAITTITLDRPDQLNAWTPHMAEELADAIGRANDDPAVGSDHHDRRRPRVLCRSRHERRVRHPPLRNRPRQRHRRRLRRYAGGSRLGAVDP
jgi:hypothetical protein